ncbi:MAG: hypothetical protein JWM56_186 [Candidatus Peribacteria bacterium]|nr:hypothetical protein [Candidatus Peribacteria bacterium]
MIITIIAIVCTFLVVAGLLFLKWKWGKHRVSMEASTLIRRQWKHVQNIEDPQRKILEADKVLDQLLRELGYRGSVSDKLKKAGSYLPYIDNVWAAHKLRNRIAHEPGMRVNDDEVRKALRSFETAISKFVPLN